MPNEFFLISFNDHELKKIQVIHTSQKLRIISEFLNFEESKAVIMSLAVGTQSAGTDGRRRGILNDRDLAIIFSINIKICFKSIQRV